MRRKLLFILKRRNIFNYENACLFLFLLYVAIVVYICLIHAFIFRWNNSLIAMNHTPWLFELKVKHFSLCDTTVFEMFARLYWSPLWFYFHQICNQLYSKLDSFSSRTPISRMQLQHIFVSIFIIFGFCFGELISINLYSKSENSSVNGLGLFSLHEGEGYNYLFLGNPKTAQKLIYDTQMYQVFFYYVYLFPYYLTLVNNFLQLSSVHYPFKIKIKKNGDLKFTYSNRLYAMKNVDDPHNYSNEYYAIYYYPKSSIVPSQAMKVTITTSIPTN